MTLPALGLVALLGARAAAAAGVDGGTCNATTAYCYVRPLFLSVGLSLHPYDRVLFSLPLSFKPSYSLRRDLTALSRQRAEHEREG